MKQENETNNRKRVKQIRKRGLEDRSFEYVKADRLHREPIGLKMRAIPRAESRLDAILASVSVALGFLCLVFVFLFFSGVWPHAGYCILASFAGICIVAAIDSWPRKRLHAWFAIAGAVILFVSIAILLRSGSSF